MRHYILPALIGLVPLILTAQESGCPPGWTTEEERAAGLYLYFDLDHPPTFPGGESGLQAWWEEHIRYPADAWRDGIEGNVVLSWIVERDGSLSRIRWCNGLGGSCGAEAVRVAGFMPRWVPGSLGGRPIRTWMTLPVLFRKRFYDPDRDFGEQVFDDNVGQLAQSPHGNRYRFNDYLDRQKSLKRRLRRKTEARVVAVPIIVEKDGSLRVSTEEPLDEAQQLLFRYVQAMGPWKAATRQGKPVRASAYLSVVVWKQKPVKKIR